jgi:hypothetical protein
MIGHLQITLDERGLFNYPRRHKYLILKTLSDPAASFLGFTKKGSYGTIIQ